MKIRVAWIACVLAVLAFVVFLIVVPPVPQDQDYHLFADRGTVFGIPNFWNVLSNLAFAVIGILGLRALRDMTARVLFAGVLLTCFGSAYYHLAPGDARLVWDRLPMAVTFMTLLVLIAREQLGPDHAGRLLAPAVALGISSVLWWRATGDLRPYLAVQFGSMLILLLALGFVRPARGLWPVLTLYVLAKLAETYDQAVYSILPLSGHTLKHVLAALAAGWIPRWRLARGARPLAASNESIAQLRDRPNVAAGRPLISPRSTAWLS